MGIRILGTGKALPEKVVSNEELSKYIDTDDEWIIAKTGIKNRRVCTTETINDLAAEAGRAAIEKSGLSPADIDLIIGATIGGSHTTPALSCGVMQRIGAKCAAFDVNAACSGFIYALDVAKCYINSGSAKNILIISGEVLSRHIDWTDRNTCILFGDGAGACVVAKGNALKYSKLGADGNVKPLFLKAGTGNNPFVWESIDMGYLEMHGQNVFKFAVKTVDEEVQTAFDKLGMSADDVDYFILHQANKRIIDGIRTRLKQPAEKFPVNIDKYGNMSAASIPVLLDEMLCEGKIKVGDTLVMIGFGAGMTTGTCVMTWE